MGLRLNACAFLLMLASTFAAAETRTVAELTITKSGAAADPDAAEMCKGFRPTARQIKGYFLRAYPVEGYFVTHERYSPCYAKGFIRFSDRSMGDWWLYSGGTATIKWNRGGSVDLMSKQGNGWRDPFAWGYGLCDERKCD